MTVFTTLLQKTIESQDFDEPVFTSVKICGADSTITIAVDATDADVALELADAIRAAALKHLQPAAVEV
jgi:hypothetical protein